MRKLTLAAAIVCLTFSFLAVQPGYSNKEKPTNTKAEATKNTSADKSEKKARKTAGKRGRVQRRLPVYFAKLELTEEQRDKVYEIDAKYRPQIQELQEQMKSLRAQRTSESVGVLTKAQKRTLKDLRQQAKQKRELLKARRDKAKAAESDNE